MTANSPPNSDEMAKITHELLRTFVQSAESDDPQKLFELAVFWIDHMHLDDPEVELGVAEGMLRFALRSGCVEAQDFMDTQWEPMKAILTRRLRSS